MPEAHVQKKEEKELESRLLYEEKETVEGIEYTFQFPGTRRTQQILDRSRMTGAFSDEVYNDFIMKEVIVFPKTDWDYWDTHKGYREVMNAADRFLGRNL